MTDKPQRFVTHATAAEAIQRNPITIKRWIAAGWLAWSEQGVTADDLIAARDFAAKKRAEAVRLAHVKYHTEDERALGRYLAVKRFRKANADKVRAEENAHRRLHRHPLFPQLKQEMIDYYGPMCLACQKRPATCIDHIKPFAQGGSTHPSNLQRLCRSCNSGKSGQTIDYRPDGGRWLKIRWGGWQECKRPRGSGRGPGSGRYLAHATYVVDQWRQARAAHHALLTPAEHIAMFGRPKSCADEGPQPTH